ncbi:asparagine synthase (glutamine-hydrolyzing) [Phreatobacter sp.]|uniref:asparagine synthase (glutamine-hydrolyzing) n=1 Tax=Phreatobacter sp. TaxID=1966341 RepID=UPI0022BA98D3|nr:asparagine synthase (glutamine-hydrolyzing) [Phreatobacter sp.]MCZ8316886.1 asparagine synthase (glutamine-hydrolyzing) [Phreatobacter sp.]
MCGLYASIGFAPDVARIDMVAHRGPDGRGWRTFASAAGPVALGHRRLAIIDVSDAGLQPMQDASRRYHLIFNGEIYNHVELRAEMEARGEAFATATDAEVLLRAYMLWGQGCLDQLRGMFAFIVWDERDKRLFAARDRFGIKPLYTVVRPREIALASEIKQLVGLPGLRGRMNVVRLHDFLAYGISDHTEETMFDGVMQLRGGECMTVEAASALPVATKRRWYPTAARDLRLSENEAAERFRSLLLESVRLHLRSDVPVGSCLSGGLDSSSIVCLASGLLPPGEQLQTISSCHAEKSADERPFVNAVVAHAGTRPHFTFPRADDVFQRAADITWHQDEPFGSTSIFAQWCVFEEARRVGVKVMLDGQGADELLAGYHSSFDFYMAALVREGKFAQFLRTLAERRRYHGSPIPAQLRRLLLTLLPWSVGATLRRQRASLTQHNWLGSDLLRAIGNTADAFTTATQSLGLAPPTDLRSLCLASTYATNLPMLLHWEDRNSMAHSIEARVPFLDHPLVEFSLALGDDHKVVGGDTKRVLRRAMHDVLPAAVRERRDKLGFATPEEIWFRGPLRPLIHEGIEETLVRYPDLFNPAGVRALRDDMLDGRRPFDFTLWRIANVGIWGERFAVTL